MVSVLCVVITLCFHSGFGARTDRMSKDLLVLESSNFSNGHSHRESQPFVSCGSNVAKPFARSGANETYKFVQAGRFVVGLDPKWPTHEAWLVLTDRRLFLFKCKPQEDCVSPALDEPSRVETDAMATATVAFATLRFGSDSAEQVTEHCAVVSGCSDTDCGSGQKTLRICAHPRKASEECGQASSSKVLREWEVAVREAYLQITNLRTELAPLISGVVDTIIANGVPSASENAPASFSPFFMLVKPETSELLRSMARSFQRGVIPHFPENTGSGAAFFFSADHAYIAKRIRRFEREAFWDAVKSGEYQVRIEGQHSLLNPIYIAFSNGPSDWIVMRAESLPADAKAHIPEERDSFFEDVKPSPLRSDRMQTAALFSQTYGSMGIKPTMLPAWPSWTKVLDADTLYLENSALVDYSLLMHGAFFFEPEKLLGKPSELSAWNAALSKSAASKEGCSFGCVDSKPRNLVDVTSFLIGNRTTRGVPVGDAEYICCCQTLHAGESASMMHPCLMVKTTVVRDEVGSYARSCSDIIESDGWQSYEKLKDRPSHGGRCLLAAGLDGGNVTRGADGAALQVIGPEAAFGIMVDPQPKACLFMCLSIFDYLLNMNAWNQIENALLLVRYGSFKWTNYRGKTKGLVDCLGHSPLPVVDQNKKLFSVEVFDKTMAGNDCEDTVASYSEKFPRLDQKVMSTRIIPEHFVSASSVSSPSNACNAQKGTFSKHCVVAPGPQGREWVQQLKSQGCTGNSFVMQLGGKFIGVKALSTDDVVTGYFPHIRAGIDSDDEEWINFAAIRMTAEVAASGEITVDLFLRDVEGPWIPLDFAFFGLNGEEHIMMRSESVRLTVKSGTDKVDIVQKRASHIEFDTFLFIFPSRKVTKFPDLHVSSTFLQAGGVTDCVPPNVKAPQEGAHSSWV